MEELLNFLMRELSYRFRSDPTVPGVVMAMLPDSYYISICRYHQPGAREKEILYQARASTLIQALTEAGRGYFVALGERDNMREWVRLAYNTGEVRPQRYISMDWESSDPLVRERIVRRTPAEVEAAMQRVSEANKSKPDPFIEKKVEEAAKKAEEAAKKSDRFELIELE